MKITITVMILLKHTLHPHHHLLCQVLSKEKKKLGSSDLCDTVTRFIISHDKSDSEDMSKKKNQLALYFEDIAGTMIKFPEVNQVETKIEIDLCGQKQISVPSVLFQY